MIDHWFEIANVLPSIRTKSASSQKNRLRAPGDTFDLWILPGSYHLIALLVEHRELEVRLRKSRENYHRSIIATIPSDVPETDPRRRSVARILEVPYFFDAPYLDNGEGQHRAETQLNVADRDLDGLLVSFAGLTRLEGIVRFAPPWQGAIPDGTQVTLQKIGDEKPGQPRSVSSEGEVALNYLSPGGYTLKVGLESENLAVQSVRHNGAEVTGIEIEVQPSGKGKLEVMAVYDLGQIDGAVETVDGIGATGVMVWVFKESQPLQLIRKLVSDQFGHFQIRHLRPGEYRAYASAQSDYSAMLRNPEAAEGTTFTVTPNGYAAVTVKVAPGRQGN